MKNTRTPDTKQLKTLQWDRFKSAIQYFSADSQRQPTNQILAAPKVAEGTKKYIYELCLFKTAALFFPFFFCCCFNKSPKWNYEKWVQRQDVAEPERQILTTQRQHCHCFFFFSPSRSLLVWIITFILKWHKSYFNRLDWWKNGGLKLGALILGLKWKFILGFLCNLSAFSCRCTLIFP